MPWGIRSVAVGVALGAPLLFVAIASIGLVADLFGRPAAFRDAGDIFVKLGEVAAYVDTRLAAAASGVELPAPPQLLGDIVTARIAYIIGALNLVVLAGIVVVASGRKPKQLAADLGLGRYEFGDAWRPIVAAVVAVFALAGYAALVRETGVGWLQPGDAAPGPVLRDGWTLALFGLVSIGLAPMVEELFFRGLVFGGLLGLGALPASAISSLLFAAWHLDLAALIPVTAIGLVLAWLAWSRATLWDAIIFHLAFNTVAFVQLAGPRP